MQKAQSKALKRPASSNTQLKTAKRKASVKAKKPLKRTRHTTTTTTLTHKALATSSSFPMTRFASRRFFSSEAAASDATEAAAAAAIENNSIQQSQTDLTAADPDAPQLYISPDLYVVRPTNVREATRIVRAFCNTPTDQPISLSINLGLDPRKPNQSVRGMAPVPHGSGGKTVLAVFAQGDKALEAKEAGADIVGAEDLIKEILAGKIEFTRCVATPDMMKHLSKVARVLGPKGLMPNPKLGTVTTDIKGAVANSKLGQIEFRNDKKGVVHAIIGKSSWSTEKLEENINAFVKAIGDAKPSGAKGQYFKTSFIGNNTGWSQNLDIRLFPFKQ